MDSKHPQEEFAMIIFFSVAFPLSCFISKASHTNDSKCSVGHFQYYTRTKVPKTITFPFMVKLFHFRADINMTHFLREKCLCTKPDKHKVSE